MYKKYLIIAPGNSIHTYKWIKEMSRYFDVYLFSIEKPIDLICDILPDTNIFGHSRLYDKLHGIKIFRLILHFFALFFGLRRVIKLLRPYVINAHFLGYNSAFAIHYDKTYNIGSKLVMSTWGSDVLVAPQNSRIQLLLSKYIFKNANIVTCECEYVKDAILDINYNTKIYKFMFGVENYDYSVKASDKNYDLYFSNRMLSKNYNIDLVISLFNKLLRVNRKLHLYIAGDGVLKDRIKELVSKCGINDNVTFLGMLSQNEQNKYYKMCGYYISIPTSDSISVSLLEAMSYGCIPIVSDLPSNRELILDGINGYVYNNEKLEYPIIDQAFNYNREYIYKHGIMEVLFKKFVEDNKLSE